MTSPVSNAEYTAQKSVNAEIELALGEMFKVRPDEPVPWMAEYFVERSAALNLPCRVATSLSARTTFEILGGVAAVTRAVDVTFLRAISDVRVAHLLNGVKVDDIKSATVAALSKAVGATADARLPQEGALLSHSDESGEIFAAHLRQSLVDLGYATHEVDVTVAAFLSLGKEKSLFERLGGAPAVDVAVDKFYEKVVNDDRVKSFFKTVDMRKQRQKQKSFLTYAFGGPNNYTSKNMRDGHRYMVRDQGLNDMHFDTIVELLAGTLKELGIPDSDIAQVGAIAESVRDDVLCRGEGLEKKEQTLFERLGGAPAVDIAVDKFYEKVVNDDRVKSFFKTVDMRKQRQKQKSFLTYAFGGPNNYTSKNMRDGHRYMVRDQGLNDMHFDTIVELLAGTLKELGIPDSDIAQVGAIAESVRDDVLCRGEGLEKKEQTLFERLGGAPAVDVAVDKFYEKVVNDDRVKSFFKTVDMRKQRQKQKSFLTYAFGGPNNYTSKNMRDGHRYMVRDQGLNDMHFDTIVELLAGTLKELGIPDSDIAQVGAIAESVRDDVLCKGEGLEKKEQTLFERLGGAPAVDVAVDKFYEKVVNDDRVKSFFKTVDMRKQRQKQKSFLTYAFGGPNNYTSKNMRDGHRYMVRDQGLNDMHFDTIVELLAGTLKELGIPDSDIAQVGAIAESVRDDVLCKGEGLEKKEQTLFERLGGAPAVDVAVDKFYEKVVNDDRVKSFFKTVDMRKQRQKQKSFLTYAFGGPNNYTSKNMRDGHRYMVRDQGLNDMHFDTIVELLAGTLKELDIPDSDIAQVGAIAESVRDDVLCRGEGLEKKEQTLFERLGGAPAVDVAVDKFYEKVVNDDRVKSFFKTVDMRKQRQKQKSFLTYAFGGPNNYTSKNMRDGHRYMVRDQGLNDMHFDTIVELLAGTLKELDIPDSDIAQVGAIAESVRDDVLCKGEGFDVVKSPKAATAKKATKKVVKKAPTKTTKAASPSAKSAAKATTKSTAKTSTKCAAKPAAKAAKTVSKKATEKN